MRRRKQQRWALLPFAVQESKRVDEIIAAAMLMQKRMNPTLALIRVTMESDLITRARTPAQLLQTNFRDRESLIHSSWMFDMGDGTKTCALFSLIRLLDDCWSDSATVLGKHK